MGIVYHLSRAKQRIVLTRRFGARWAKAYLSRDLRPADEVFRRSDGKLEIPSLSLIIPEPDELGMLALSCVENLSLLRRKLPISVEIYERGLLVQVDGVRCYAESADDAIVLHEIFGERLYDFHIPGPHFIVDCGLNLGYATLFFLGRYDAEVWAYELVPSTAKLAVRNLSLNPDLASRATVHEVGLADRDDRLSIGVDPARRPGSGLFRHESGGHICHENVEVRDAADVFSEIVAARGERSLVLKLDVEGAEYEILGRLAETGQIAEIRLLMMEWHYRHGKDPQEIVDLLIRSGFSLANRLHPTEPLGYITAWR